MSRINKCMTTDKTGAETTVSAADGKYTIAVDGQTVGLAAVADRGNQRVFYHTEVDERFGGRGLATMADFLKKHPEFSDIADPATPAILQWVETL